MKAEITRDAGMSSLHGSGVITIIYILFYHCRLESHSNTYYQPRGLLSNSSFNAQLRAHLNVKHVQVGRTVRSESSGALREVELLWDPKSLHVWLFTDNFLERNSEVSGATGGSAWGEEMAASEMLFLTVSIHIYRKKRWTQGEMNEALGETKERGTIIFFKLSKIQINDTM